MLWPSCLHFHVYPGYLMHFCLKTRQLFVTQKFPGSSIKWSPFRGVASDIPVLTAHCFASCTCSLPTALAAAVLYCTPLLHRWPVVMCPSPTHSSRSISNFVSFCVKSVLNPYLSKQEVSGWYLNCDSWNRSLVILRDRLSLEVFIKTKLVKIAITG